MKKKEIQKLFSAIARQITNVNIDDLDDPNDIQIWIVAKNLQEAIKRIEKDYPDFDILNINFVASSDVEDENSEILIV